MGACGISALTGCSGSGAQTKLSDRSGEKIAEEETATKHDTDVKISSEGDHTEWLFKPRYVDLKSSDSWYGYSLLRTESIPDGYPWKEPYTRYGIEKNLQHYAMGSRFNPIRLGTVT